MLISSKGRYALRLAVCIAQAGPEAKVSLREVAEREELSLKYLEQIARPMASAGLLASVRGKGGGYRLSKPAKEYTAFEVLSLTEGTLAPVTCLERGQQCENAVNCRTLPLWQGLDQVIAAYLCSYTLADLTREENPQPKRRRTKT